ncbi:hypothetical protein ABZ470_39975 [Streptosporangium sp. NPDC020072]|uniref:hypothetical protein n=1 Tax=Streptosporangium sp. NPDC020072 TaxID=3154788 RepID=UPI0034329E11
MTNHSNAKRIHDLKVGDRIINTHPSGSAFAKTATVVQEALRTTDNRWALGITYSGDESTYIHIGEWEELIPLDKPLAEYAIITPEIAKRITCDFPCEHDDPLDCLRQRHAEIQVGEELFWTQEEDRLLLEAVAAEAREKRLVLEGLDAAEEERGHTAS